MTTSHTISHPLESAVSVRPDPFPLCPLPVSEQVRAEMLKAEISGGGRVARPPHSEREEARIDKFRTAFRLSICQFTVRVILLINNTA